MVIKSLKLKNYRNYDLLDLKFDPKTNILYGDNAQGKTNILEALYPPFSTNPAAFKTCPSRINSSPALK